MIRLQAEVVEWPLEEPFTISRGTMTAVEGLLITLLDGQGNRGRGEAFGITYEGENPGTMLTQIGAVQGLIEAGATREELLAILPSGGARCAVDCAMWDLEAKAGGWTVADHIGVAPTRGVHTAFTIGMRAPGAMEATARRFADHSLLKVKVDTARPIEMLEEINRGAPNAKLIVDPNQSWTIDHMNGFMDDLQRLNVVLLEQPLPVDGDEGLRGYQSPIPICADELIHDRADLPKAEGKYQVINVKLDKAGGLTEGMALAREARKLGYGLMVGCMAGSSLAMAPAHMVAQLCDFVDLDGPLLQAADWPHAMVYERGVVFPPGRDLWG